jgi:hypothetical protein
LPTESSSSPLNLTGRIPELDGIRGIAIGMVLIAHFFAVVTRPGSGLAYALVPLRRCRLSWVYFEKPLVHIGHHRTSYQFGAAGLAKTVPVPAEGS